MKDNYAAFKETINIDQRGFCMGSSCERVEEFKTVEEVLAAIESGKYKREDRVFFVRPDGKLLRWEDLATDCEVFHVSAWQVAIKKKSSVFVSHANDDIEF
jgi:hypothetical protein